MATLSSALNYALSGLSVTATQSALVSRNVSFAGDENYTRKTAEIYTLPGGAPAVSGYGRSMDKQLLEKLLGATSNTAGKQTVVDALNRMSATTGDPEADGSLASLMGKLQESLRLYETNPLNATLASSSLEAGRGLATKLNETSGEILAIRSEADGAMAESVGRINTLLSQFKVANDSIVRGTGSPGDLSEALDLRDSILKQLSEEIGIRTTTRANNDILIYAEGGAVLFEGSPRAVTMQATPIFGAATAGQTVYIDGVAVTGQAAPMPISGGKLSSLAKVRDELTFMFQSQVDQIASGLIRSFAEREQSIPSLLPDIAGLFIDPAGGLPVAGTPSPGLAARISINPLADPEQGGNPSLIRDGGFGGPAYIYNQQGSVSYQQRIGQLINALDAPLSFDAGSGLSASSSLKNFGIQSAAWVEAQRQTAQTAADSAGVMRVRASESLLRITGVNIDQEMAALLDLEKSYQASSKVISVIDAMLATLLDAVR